MGMEFGKGPVRGMEEEAILEGLGFLPFCDNISLIWQGEGKSCPMEPKAIIPSSISLISFYISLYSISYGNILVTFLFLQYSQYEPPYSSDEPIYF